MSRAPFQVLVYPYQKLEDRILRKALYWRMTASFGLCYSTVCVRWQMMQPNFWKKVAYEHTGSKR
jgi:hypothetical protein